MSMTQTRFLSLEENPNTYLGIHSILDEPAADALLSDRELELRRTTRQLVAQDIAPRAAETDRSHSFTSEQVRSLADAKLMGLVFPENYGGTNDTNVSYAAVVEEIAAGCAATSLVFVTQMHTAYPLLLAGSEDLKSRYIPGLLNGTQWGSLGITEPNAGSDVSSMQTTARKGSDGYVLNGSKTFITTGDVADVIVSFATADLNAGRDGIGAFVVDGAAEGVSRSQPFEKLGMNGSSTAEVFFDDVRVAAANVLAEPGQGWSVVMQSVIKSRISAAAQGIGIARAAYARTLHALHQRYGYRLSDELTFALATLRGRILQGRLLMVSVSRQLDDYGDVAPGQIGMMKQSCTDLGWEVSLECMRILGAWGDFEAIGVERCTRDSKVTQIYDGTNEIQRLLIGRETNKTLKDFS